MAYQQPIMLYKGTANTIKIVVFNSKQKVVDLTGYEVQVQLVDRETQEHFVTKTGVVDTPASGIASIHFTEADLRGLENRFYHIIARLTGISDGSSIIDGEILYLDDNYGAFTPVTIENAWNYNPTSISTVNGIPEISFTNIRETPDSYAGQAGKFVRVANNETGVEFSTINFGDLTGSVTGNIIPQPTNTYYLGNSDYHWHSIYVNNGSIGNLTIANTNISATTSDTISFSVNNRHTFSFTDVSTTTLEYGVGSIFRFDDTGHGNGPSFQTWYGDLANPDHDPLGQHSLDIQASNANSYVEFASHDEDSYVGVDARGAFIQTNWNSFPNDKEWRFFSDGIMKLPAGTPRITADDGSAAIVFNANNLTIQTNSPDGSTIHLSSFNDLGGLTLDGPLLPVGDSVYSLGSPDSQWKDLYVSNTTIYMGGVPLSIDDNGDLTVNGNTISGSAFTIDTVNLHNGGVQSAQILQFTDSQYQSVITGPTPDAGNTAQRLIIQGQRATGQGEGGDVYLWGGDSQVNGGDIKIYAGDADGTESGSGGYVNISAGNGFNQGGSISITAGNSSNGTGGDLTLAAGVGSATVGRILINNNLNEWSFDRDGVLNLPANGVIRNPNINQRTNIVSGGDFVQLQWTTPQGAAEADPNATTELLHWLFVESGGIYLETNVNGIGDQNSWLFDTTGGLRFPDATIQTTAFTFSNSATAPSTGLLWFNPVEARMYVRYNNQWIDANPTILPPPDINPTLESVTFNDATVQTTAWSGVLSYNDLIDKPAFVGGGGAASWLTAG